VEDASLGAFLKQVTIIGAGWAGLSAAVHAVQAGWQVRLLEAAPHTGGRARRVMRLGQALDNGQHILIGAYSDTLTLMRTVGVDTDHHLWRMPLTLRFADGQGVQLPAWPAPLNVLAGIVNAKGWPWPDKWAFIRRAVQWQIQGFDCPQGMTVAQLCNGLSATVMSLMIEPLCVSALNLPARDASAKVFLRVLRDALLSGNGSSDMLIPRSDQSVLLPDAAVRWLGLHDWSPRRCADRTTLLTGNSGLSCVGSCAFDAIAQSGLGSTGCGTPAHSHRHGLCAGKCTT
jgi:predicted NAD/FAD-binding protein